MAAEVTAATEMAAEVTAAAEMAAATTATVEETVEDTALLQIWRSGSQGSHLSIQLVCS